MRTRDCYYWTMSSRFFRLFCEMIDKTPVQAVVPLAKAEYRMMEDDLAQKRLPDDDDTHSILGFCGFLLAAGCATGMACMVLPLEHFAFYRNTVERLVAAGELPYDAKDRFDSNFFAFFTMDPPLAVAA